MTIHELAKELNLSAATVSLALNGDKRIAEATRRKIADYAAKTGYRVNEQARNLRLGRSGLVALIVGNIATEFWAGTVKAMETSLGEAYSVLVCNSDGSPEKERRIVEKLRARRIDGLVIQPVRNDDVSHLAEAEDAGTPVVLLERSEDERLSFVKGDDCGAAKKAVETLAGHGHRKIAFLMIKRPGHIGLADRKRGFLEAAAEAGISGAAKVIDSENLTPQALKGFSAVICSDDSLVIPLLAKLEPCGLRCTEDMSVLCWNNRSYLDLLKPSVSRFDIPVAKMGAAAAERILRFLSGDKTPLRTLLEEPLLIRDSISKSKVQ